MARVRGRGPTRVAVVAVVVAVAFALVACSHETRGYTDATEVTFMAACTAQQSQPAALCKCAYDEIVREIPFDTYADYDRRLRKDPNDITDDVKRIVSDCANRPGISSSSSS